MKSKSSAISLCLGVLWTLLLLSVLTVVSVVVNGTQTLDVLSGPLRDLVSLRFDALSALMFFMVSLLGVSVGHYSVRYLDGEKRQAYFFRYMLALVVSVCLLVLSNDLLMFFVMWMLTSLSLHKLLLFYPERPAAVAAARKKQIISRLGDLALLGAVSLAYWFFGSSDLSTLFATASSYDHTSQSETVVNVIGLLLTLGAIAKSAQFPCHFWLPETMETPTPVSALMHAGVINAGGFLIIRFSPILEVAYLAHALLLLFGAFTAVYGALIMMTQNNIKKKLAYSTISQMGLMLFACGLGAYSIALMHIIAHSFYKAHAFLATGNLVEESRKSGLTIRPLNPYAVVGISALGFLSIYMGGVLFEGAYTAVFTYAAVMLLALSQNAFTYRGTLADGVKMAFAIAAVLTVALTAYVYSETNFAGLLQTIVPSLAATSKAVLALQPVTYLAFAFFAAGLWLSSQLMAPRSAATKRLYMHLWNGGYAGQMSTLALSRFMSRR